MMFEEALAVLFGVDEAIMLQNLMYWIKKNKANNKHFYDGRYWTYNSASAFEKLFAFWNKAKIYRVLDSLEKQGAIFSGNYNRLAYDRTKWYSVSEHILEGVWSEKTKLQERDIHVPEVQNGNTDCETPIPDINTKVNNSSKQHIESVPPPQFQPYGEYGNIKLTTEQYDKLFERYGFDADKYINEMDSWVQAKGKQKEYKDWNAGVHNWVRRDKLTQTRGGQKSQAQQQEQPISEVSQYPDF